MTDELKQVRVRFDEGETGWGREVEPGRVLIDNIPISDRLNIDDLVEVDPKETGFLNIIRVLERAFPGKTAIRYSEPYKETYGKLYKAWHDAGMKCEGPFEGLVIVAHQAGQDPVKVALDAGVTVTLNDPQPALEAIQADLVRS
jgi:hypothetical protein